MFPFDVVVLLCLSLSHFLNSLSLTISLALGVVSFFLFFSMYDHMNLLPISTRLTYFSAGFEATPLESSASRPTHKWHRLLTQCSAPASKINPVGGHYLLKLRGKLPLVPPFPFHPPVPHRDHGGNQREVMRCYDWNEGNRPSYYSLTLPRPNPQLTRPTEPNIH